MKTSHHLLLLAILGIIVWLLVAVGRVLRKGQQASKNQMRWREIDDFDSIQKAARISQFLSRASMVNGFILSLCSFVSFVVKRFSKFALIRVDSRPKSLLIPFEEALADPIDGTTFQKNEPVIRCTCGAAYHTHSWQWVLENHSGKCVTCKQAS